LQHPFQAVPQGSVHYLSQTHVCSFANLLYEGHNVIIQIESLPHSSSIVNRDDELYGTVAMTLRFASYSVSRSPPAASTPKLGCP